MTVTNTGSQSGSLASGFTYNASVAIGFAQVASANPQTPTATVSVSYPAAQTAGDLNVVAVGWNDTTSTISSVKDSVGNSYSVAIGPTTGTGMRQSIYYAANIAGGTNTVTVTFSQAAAFPDVRILEYRGVTALDVTAGASGTSTSASSGAATTTSANELIFGADYVSTLTNAAGSGFTSRIITSPDGDIAEDKVVTTAGSNSATATLTGSGPWVMQMATFAAVSGPVPTVTSVSPSSGSSGGGTAVTITGTNFVSGAGVTIGGVAATGVTVVNSTTITATTPAGTAGAVTVTVTNPGGQSGSLASGYTYVAGPAVTSVSPSSGPAAGGTAVTITGTNFASGATVTFAGTAASNVTVVNNTTITATTPAGSAGAATVTVTMGGQSGSLAGGFTYIGVPTVTGVSPNSGSTLGGTAVTVTGTNFATGATVTLRQHGGDQRNSGEQHHHHGDHAGGHGGRSDSDRDQPRLPERNPAQRLHLCADTDSDQREPEQRTTRWRDGSEHHGDQLRRRGDGDVRGHGGDERGGSEQHDHHGDDACGERGRGDGDGDGKRAERQPGERVHLRGAADGEQRESGQRVDIGRYRGDHHGDQLRRRGDGEVRQRGGSQRDSGEQHHHHGDHAGGQRRGGNGDGDQHGWAERQPGQRLHLYRAADGEQREPEQRSGGGRYGGDHHGNELRHGRDSDLREYGGDERGGGEQHHHHGDHAGGQLRAQ